MCQDKTSLIASEANVRLTPSERETAHQLLAGGWSIPKVAHAMARARRRRSRTR